MVRLRFLEAARVSVEEATHAPADAPRGIYGPDGQPQFFLDPAMDRFVAVLMKLSQELWVLSERVDVLEWLSSVGLPLLKEHVDSLINNPQVAQQRDARLAEFLHRVLGQLREPR